MPSRLPRQEPLRIVADHLLLERAGRLELLDTGVPDSMPCPRVVSEVLGVEVDRLIGCREIARGTLRIDWPARTATHDAEPEPDAVAIPLRTAAFGVPMIPLATPAGTVHAVLDTGAALSYAPPEAVRGLTPLRHTEDFLPGFGRFEVDVYRLDVRVGGVPLSVEVGVLPALLRMALGMLCPDGWILGSALFRDRVITLDLARSVVHVSPIGFRDPDDLSVERPHDSECLADERFVDGSAPPVTEGRTGGFRHALRLDAARRADGAVHVRAVLTLRGTETPEPRPVRLALALDRSGSMSGDRIEAVRAAARAAVHRLPKGSSIAITTYAATAADVLPLTANADPSVIAAADEALARLEAGGSTALADGWRAGRDQLASAPPDREVGSPHPPLRRVLLLSDGHANVGERSPSVLARWCATATRLGITTSTVGIGAGYDEDLLRGMAVAGGGSTWYVPTPADADAVLAEEVRAMCTVSALHARVQVASADAALLDCLGGLAAPEPPSGQDDGFADHRRGTERHVSVGELSDAAERSLVFEFLVPSSLVGTGPVALGTVIVTADDPAGTATFRVDLPLVWDGRVLADLGARPTWLGLRVAAARQEAVRAADARRFEEAARCIGNAISLLEHQPEALRPSLATVVEELEELRHRLRRRQFDARARKHTLQRADNTVTGKALYDRMLRLD